MPITINFDRPLLDPNSAIMESIEVGGATASGNAVELRVFFDDLDIPDNTVTTGPTWSTGSTIINGTGSDFTDVREGDIVTSATDFAGPSDERAVQSIDYDLDQITLVNAPANDTNSGAEDLVIKASTNSTLDATLYNIRFLHQVAGTTLTVTPRISCHDGLNVKDGSVIDGSDSGAFSFGAVQKTLPSFQINLDTYLENARVPRA